MPWLNHPKYIPTRDALIAQWSRKRQHFRRMRHVVFLCGGFNSSRRDQIDAYLAKFHKDLLVFYADNVWNHISGRPGANALLMEEQLAQLADVVVIIVESPGTMAELGAFSVGDALRKKLLVLMKDRYKNSNSFINTGPIRWVDADSKFKPVIYTSFAPILSCAVEIDERLSRLSAPRSQSVTDLPNRPKHLLFMLCDLVQVIGPVRAEHAAFYLEKILGVPPVWQVDGLLGLASEIGFLESKEVNGSRYYMVTDAQAQAKPFVYRRFLNLDEDRARMLSALQRIAEPVDILKNWTI